MPEHDELAMGEIDEIHHAPDQREAGREQGVDGPQQEAADDDLQQEHGDWRRRYFQPFIGHSSLAVAALLRPTSSYSLPLSWIR